MRSMNAFNNSANNSLSLANMNFLPLTSEVHFLNQHKNLLPTFDYLSSGSTANFNPMELPLLELNNSLAFARRRSRCEKRPIPEAQKDEKYYERRKRNNEAAKKSRDARKIREDRIAFRAAFLEQENTILRAQILTLRDELQTLKQLLRTRSENDQLRNAIF